MKLLIVEDEKGLSDSIAEYLSSEDYISERAFTFDEAMSKIGVYEYDCILLDLMLPGGNGLDILREIKRLGLQSGVIIVSAKDSVSDKVEGLKIGADDYLSKPFSMEELLYRIESILRRVRGKKSKDVVTYQIGGFTFDAQKQTLEFDGEIKKLTTKESELLNLLAANANNILERNFALKTIWVDDNYFNARSMDVYITKLRKLLKEDSNVAIINIHGKGYKLIMPQVKED